MWETFKHSKVSEGQNDFSQTGMPWYTTDKGQQQRDPSVQGRSGVGPSATDHARVKEIGAMTHQAPIDQTERSPITTDEEENAITRVQIMSVAQADARKSMGMPPKRGAQEWDQHPLANQYRQTQTYQDTFNKLTAGQTAANPPS
jgi:hypothetical protein